jgi:hypothetical protein
VEAGARLVIKQNPLPPTPPKRAASIDFHGEECGILAYESNAGEASTRQYTKVNKTMISLFLCLITVGQNSPEKQVETKEPLTAFTLAEVRPILTHLSRSSILASKFSIERDKESDSVFCVSSVLSSADDFKIIITKVFTRKDHPIQVLAQDGVFSEATTNELALKGFDAVSEGFKGKLRKLLVTTKNNETKFTIWKFPIYPVSPSIWTTNLDGKIIMYIGGR